ncbi:MAG: hypothetical protein R3F20_06780 [Planctomycetota bacterium]
MLEDAWMAQGFGLARRAHLGAGRRLDLIVRRAADPEAPRP